MAAPPYEALLQAVPAFFAQLSLDGRFLYVNRVAPGLTEAQVLGASFYDFIAEADRPVARACFARVLESGEPSEFPSMGHGPHGELVPYFTLVAPVREGGKIASFATLGSDVRHVAAAHQALAASEEKLRLALEATGMGIWSVDSKRGEVTWDARIAEIFGYAPAPITVSAAVVMGHTHPEDVARVREASVRARDGAVGPIEHRIVRKDGGVRWVSSTGRIDPRTGMGIGGIIDITELKAQEERLTQAQKLDSIGRLAGGVAHDFNNMLTAILGYTDICLRRAPAGSAMIDDLQEIKRSAERSRELTSRLLTFARKQLVQRRVVDPNALVGEVQRLLQRIVGEDVAISTRLAATGNVRVDPSQLEQLLLNLATNARDAMPKGGRLELVTSDVVLDPDAELAGGPHVRIVVSDTGVGITPDVLEHIFEPFFTTKESGKGTGLGLAQCYGIARQAGGRLRIASRAGQGTQVTIELPAVTEAADAPKAPAPTAARGKETVLLVEDEPQLRKLTARMLREHGYQVLEAPDGQRALEVSAAHAGELHVVLTDMVMPGMTGTELVVELKARRPTTIAIVMTGYAPQLSTDGSIAAVLAKPFMSQELLAVLRGALDPPKR